MMMVDLYGHIVADGLESHHQLDEVNDDAMMMMMKFALITKEFFVAVDDIEMYHVDQVMIDPLDLMLEHLQWPKIVVVDLIHFYHALIMEMLLTWSKLVYLFSTMMLFVLLFVHDDDVDLYDDY